MMTRSLQTLLAICAFTAILSPARATDETGDLAYSVTIKLNGQSVYSGIAHVAIGEMTTLDHRTPFPLKTTCKSDQDGASHESMTTGKTGQTVKIGATSMKDGLATTLIHLSSAELIKKLKVTANGCVGETAVMSTWDTSTSFQVGLTEPQTLSVGDYTVTVQLMKTKEAVHTSAPLPLSAIISA